MSPKIARVWGLALGLLGHIFGLVRLSRGVICSILAALVVLAVFARLLGPSRADLCPPEALLGLAVGFPGALFRDIFEAFFEPGALKTRVLEPPGLKKA